MKKIFFSLFFLCLALTANAVEVGKWYSIRNGFKALIIQNASMQNSAPLVLWTPTNVPSQLWRVEQNDDGTYSFVEGYMGEFLASMRSPAENVKIVARTTLRSNTGQWNLVPVEGKTDTYRIVSKNGLYCLSVTESVNGIQPTLVSTAEPTGNCDWTFREYTAKEVQTGFNTVVRDEIIDGFMKKYYRAASTGHVFGAGGFWGDAEMIETILDAFETTGDKKYQIYYTELVKNFLYRNGSDWCSVGLGWPRSNEYNDDIAWMVLALVRGYKYFGISSHLELAKKNFDKMWNRALQDGGTLRWKQVNETWYGSNSCINGPAINAACYLYDMTGDEGYLTKAKNLWEKQYQYLCDKNDGHVWDSGNWNNSWTTFTVGNYWGSTYNQGTMLGACVNLYRLTGDAKYKAYADKVWNWAYKSLCSKKVESMNVVNACQTAVGDLCGFKGILMRYCRLYAEELYHENVRDWLSRNAWFAYQNANSKGVIWSKWLTKTSEDFNSQEGSELKSFNNDAFGASTAVSAAVNAHVNGVFKKDAYSLIGAEMMDDICFMQLSTTFDDDAATPNTTKTNKGFLCFKNVDFGTADVAVKCQLRLFSSADGGTYTIYIDKISEGNKLGTVMLTAGWNTYTIDITPTTGRHKVFAVPGATTHTQFHNMQFHSSTSGISTVGEAEAKGKPGIYNLSGQRISEKRKGINIVDGRKVLVR